LLWHHSTIYKMLQYMSHVSLTLDYYVLCAYCVTVCCLRMKPFFYAISLVNLISHAAFLWN
jgi:hypothetical protein